MPLAYTSCIAIGETEKELFVTYSNYGVKSVWYSPDEGKTWFDKEANLPDIPVRWILPHPSNSDHVLLATESGIWETSNFKNENISWELSNLGMPNIRVDMLRFRESDNYVLAATHGRGFYSTNWNINTNAEKIPSDSRISIFPNPFYKYLTVKTENEFISEINIFNLNGQLISNESGLTDKEITLHLYDLPKGEYLIQVVYEGNKSATEKIVKF